MIDVVVTGRSWPALQSALDLAEVGLKVVVVAGAAQQDAGLMPAMRDPEGIIAAFMERVAQEIVENNAAENSTAEQNAAEEDTVEQSTDVQQSGSFSAARPVTQVAPATLLRDRKGGWAEQPDPNLLGVPAVPLAEQSLALLGGGGAFRAYVDRFTPLLTVGKTQWFGDLVRKRMGAAVVQRLVDPQVCERYGVPAQSVEVAVAAPGLNEALSRAGALSSAVLAYSDRNVARETRVSAYGGSAALTNVLLHKLEMYGVQLRDEQATQITHEGECWNIALDSGEQIDCRAVVADFGSHPTVPGNAPVAESDLAPKHGRMYASINIDSAEPRNAIEDRHALSQQGDWAVRTISLARTEEGVAFRAHLSGPRVPVDSVSNAQAAQPQVHDLEVQTQLATVLRDSKLRPSQGAEWAVTVEAAPFVNLDERHRSEVALARAISSQPTLSPVGRSLHGAEEDVALKHAHRQAVELRRRLLGLEVDGE